MRKPEAVREVQGKRQVAASIITALPLQLLPPVKGSRPGPVAASSAGRIKIGAGLVFRQQPINHWLVVLQVVAEAAKEELGRRKVEAARNRRRVARVNLILGRVFTVRS